MNEANDGHGTGAGTGSGTVIQGPHCLIDAPCDVSLSADQALDLVADLARALEMRRLGETRIVRGPARRDGRRSLCAYQVISTSHIVIHVSPRHIHADLFSCEPFDVDRCVSEFFDRVEGADPATALVQYCQRTLRSDPGSAPAIAMANLNRLTGNPDTLTHALVNWYGGNERALGDVEQATRILRAALTHMAEPGDAAAPPASVLLLDVAPVPSSWDTGGVSGGYINLFKQLTIHTFAAQGGAYTDIMAHTFDLEAIIRVLREGFDFAFWEVDGIFQRSRPHWSGKQETTAERS